MYQGRDSRYMSYDRRADALTSKLHGAGYYCYIRHAGFVFLIGGEGVKWQNYTAILAPHAAES